MAVANPTAAGESNEVDLSAKLATREVASMKNTSHLEVLSARRQPLRVAVDLAGYLCSDAPRTRPGPHREIGLRRRDGGMVAGQGRSVGRRMRFSSGMNPPLAIRRAFVICGSLSTTSRA